jgi:gliding motility-associated-like protein
MTNQLQLLRDRILPICLCTVFVFLTNKIFGQISCADSTQTIIYSSASFQNAYNIGAIPTTDNGVIIYDKIPSVYQPNDSLVIFKIKQNGDPDWAKKIRIYNGINLWKNIQEMSNGNIELNGGVFNDLCPTCLNNPHLILDNTGTPFLQADYTNQNADTGWQVSNSAPDQSIVIAGMRGAPNSKSILIQRLDTLQTPDGFITNGIWQRNYLFSNGTPEIEVSDLYVINNFVYAGGIYNDPQLKTTGFWMLKLDYATGNIIMSRSYQLNDPSAATNSLLISGSNFSPYAGNNFIFSIASNSQKNENIFLQLDPDMNILHQPIALSSSMASASNRSVMINNSGSAIYSVLLNNSETYYAAVDSSNKIIDQHKITFINNGDQQPLLCLRNDNVIAAILPVPQGNNLYFQITDIIPGLMPIAECITTKDTNFISSRPILCTNSAMNWNVSANKDISGIAIPQIQTASDFITTSQVACQQKSICDSLKINGATDLCFSNSVFKFTATKNDLCFKKINWSADADLVSVLDQINDTTVSLQFKNSGKGYLIANIAGCGLADSLLLTVSGANKVFIGNDTSLCPGTSDTLHASLAYQKYLWQNGSTDPFYIAKDAGVYYLTATDICNNTSSDTISVKYDTSKVSEEANVEICKEQDTILSANNGFTNYNWQPANAIVSNNLSQSISIKPAETTTYFVSARSMMNCIITDSIKVIVENCLNKLVMPNAFTPDNNGRNDLIKPSVFGILEKYNFEIYDRLGQLVFHSVKQGEGWDGKINGARQNEGVYVWFCQYQFAGDKEKIAKGTFVLIK